MVQSVCWCQVMVLVSCALSKHKRNRLTYAYVSRFPLVGIVFLVWSCGVVVVVVVASLLWFVVDPFKQNKKNQK